MANDVERGWTPAQVYAMAGICLFIGVVLGYLFRGSESHTAQTLAVSQATSAGNAASAPTPPMPSLEDMKHMADKQAEPLLAKLKADPKNADVLKQVAKVYESTHQFKDAATYYGKAIEVDPKDVPTRIQMASCLFYSGDVDGSLAQLEQALKIDPKDVNSQFDLGWIRMRGKNDAKGAIAAWTQLLKTNPQLEPAKKAQVEKLIAEVRSNTGAK
jgi:cytochrome c-type biogenesis protein CcmH/NrfG